MESDQPEVKTFLSKRRTLADKNPLIMSMSENSDDSLERFTKC